MRPKHITKHTQFKEIILCAFYSAPKSKKNAKLLDHMIGTMQVLLTKYPMCGYAAGGDINQFPLGPLLGALPKCRQLVTKFTYRGCNGGKIYDVLLTNMGQFYNVPYIAKAVSPDEPNSRAVPSDHDMAVAEPLAGAGCARLCQQQGPAGRTSQPFPQSGLSQFRAWLHSVGWQQDLDCGLDPTQMACKAEGILGNKVMELFPTKSVRVSPSLLLS